MSKYNRKGTVAQAPAKGFIATARTATGKAVETKTYNGAVGFARDAKGDLFLLAASSLMAENTYYEAGSDRVARFTGLIQQLVKEDPAWVGKFLVWLRGEGNIRTAAIIGAVEAADAMAKAGVPGGRFIVRDVLQRADEPGEMVAYWLSTRGRKTMPKPLKRGIADGAVRLYNEFSVLKYDTDRAAVRFADVLDLCHPSYDQPEQATLFKFILDRRHGRDMKELIPDTLQMVRHQQVLRTAFNTNPDVLLNPDNLRQAGMTWEDALSLGGSKVDKAALWKSLIPTMGYMALLRNLRNFDDAGLSGSVVADLAKRLADPVQVAKSRQFPYRFFTAYKELASVRWAEALELAFNLSVQNIPLLSGKTLILIDTSGSMQSGVSQKSKMTYGQAAAVFGMAVAGRGDAEVYGFADGVFGFPVRKGSSVLKNVDSFVDMTGKVGYGTNIGLAIQKTWDPNKFDRMFVFSDEQTSDRVPDAALGSTKPVYFYNLAGYKASAIETKGSRYLLGGLTDATFRLIPMLEQRKSGLWPWETKTSDSK